MIQRLYLLRKMILLKFLSFLIKWLCLQFATYRSLRNMATDAFMDMTREYAIDKQ